MRSIDWQDGLVRFLDQTALPLREEYVETAEAAVIGEAIRALRIRGAPAIGVAAAFGVALAAAGAERNGPDAVLAAARGASEMLRLARPTAVNLFAALDRMDAIIGAHRHSPARSLSARLRDEARMIQQEDISSCDRIADLGSPLIPRGSTVLTHCNTGALATAGSGTALNVILAAWREGRVERVFVDETRPLLQGARLTMWELRRAGVPSTLITDNAAAFVMRQGKVNAVLVGADRIAANGDVANKIGTYGVAVLARAHGIPMYVAAPFSTVDPGTPDGAGIQIEERDPAEVTAVAGVALAPDGVNVYAPAFDVTPASLVDAIITDRGVARAPYGDSLSALMHAVPSRAGSDDMIVDTEAIVLHGRDYSDSSRILSLYTLSHGRMSAIAKGVKRSAARHGMSLDPMSHIRAVLYVKDTRDLQLLSRFEAIEALGGLMSDMDRMAAGLAVVELIGAVTPQNEANDAVFRLVTSTLRAIRNATNRPRNALYHFEAHLLREIGFQPSFDRCTHCGKAVADDREPDRRTLRLGHAGVVCHSCIDRHHGLFPVSAAALSVLRELQLTPTAEEAVARDFGSRLGQEVDAALRRCLQMNVETLGRLKTRDVFHALGRMP